MIRGPIDTHSFCDLFLRQALLFTFQFEGYCKRNMNSTLHVLLSSFQKCVDPLFDREQTTGGLLVTIYNVRKESGYTMLKNSRSTPNESKHPVEPAIYLNKAEAASLWTNDAFREKIMQLCSPQGKGIKRLRDMEIAVIRLLNELAPMTRRTLGHAGGLSR